MVGGSQKHGGQTGRDGMHIMSALGLELAVPETVRNALRASCERGGIWLLPPQKLGWFCSKAGLF